MVPDGFSLVGRSMHPSEFVPCAQWGQHLGGISGHSLKYSSAGVTSSAIFTVGDFKKLQCSFCQQDPYYRTQGIFSVIPFTQ